VIGLLVLAGTTTQAATKTWTGTTGTDFATPGNWSGGVPSNNDYSDIARFTENSPSNKSPTLASGRSVNKVIFDNSVGWTLGGGDILFKVLESSGAGTNTINAIKSQASNQTWTIGTGNTVIINTFAQDGSGVQTTIQGGGSMQVRGQVGYSYSTNKDFVIKSGTTLRVASSTVYSNATGQTHIASDTAALLLLTSVANATAQIGTKIIDDYGAGLTVTDIGGGYVKIASVPKPASLAMLAAAGLMLGRRRRA